MSRTNLTLCWCPSRGRRRSGHACRPCSCPGRGVRDQAGPRDRAQRAHPPGLRADGRARQGAHQGTGGDPGVPELPARLEQGHLRAGADGRPGDGAHRSGLRLGARRHRHRHPRWAVPLRQLGPGQEDHRLASGPEGQRQYPDPRGLPHPLLGVLLRLRHVISDKGYPSPAEIKGKKVRVPPNPMWVETFKSMGAVPTPLQWSEVYSGLSQGVVDAAEAPLSTLYGSKLFEVKKVVTLTGHFKAVTGVGIGESFSSRCPRTSSRSSRKRRRKADAGCRRSRSRRRTSTARSSRRRASRSFRPTPTRTGRPPRPPTPPSRSGHPASTIGSARP